jgi:PAS domain S-box-containing protein
MGADASTGPATSAARDGFGPREPDGLTVLETTAALFGRLEPAGVVEALLETALSWSGASRALLMRLAPDGLRIEAEGASTGQGAEFIQRPAAPAPDDRLAALAHRVIRTNQVVQVGDGPERIGLPLPKDGELGEALCLEAGSSGRFSPETVALLTAVARAGATALGNAHRMAALQNKVARMTPLYDANVMGVFSWDLAGRVTDANDAFLEIVGYSRDDLARGLINWVKMTPPEYRERDEQAIAELMADKQARPFEKEYVRKDGVRVPLMLGVSRFEESLNEGVCVAIDVSELKAAEARLADALSALQESRARLGAALQAGRMGVWRRRLSDNALDPSPELNVLLGYPPDQPLTTDDLRRGLLGDPVELNAARDRAVAADQPVFEIEYAYRRPDTGEVRWFLVRNEIVRDAANEPQEIVGLVIDITERKRHEERQQLLLNELNHRVKNTLSVVLGIVDQTLRNTRSPGAFAEALQGRLQALSKSHNLLTDRVWQGAGLRDVLASELAAWVAPPGEQIVLDGENLMVGPKGVVTLGLVMHELVANAVRHGALSVPEGRIDLTWRLDDDQNLHIVWREHGGPPVSPPHRKGFGMKLMERGLAREFGGGVRIDFAPEGFRCEMRLSMARMAQT